VAKEINIDSPRKNYLQDILGIQIFMVFFLKKTQLKLESYQPILRVAIQTLRYAIGTFDFLDIGTCL
jgi:hypothetical protein